MSCANVEEVPGSRTGNRTKAQRKYYVHNASNEENAIAAVEAFIPTYIGNLPILDYSYQEMDEIDDAYNFTVEWGFEDGGTGDDLPSSEYRFNFQASGGKFIQSLATISYHTAEGSDTDPDAVHARNFQGQINVTKDKEGNRTTEGQDVQPPAETFTLVYRDDNAVINGAYQLLVESLVGKVASSSFRGRAAGSLMLVRAQGSRAGGVWTIEFGFAYIPNATNIPVGDNIVVAAKDGFDLLWTYYEPQEQDFEIEVGVTYPEIIPLPGAAYVERVFERADLNTLNLPV